MTYADWYGLTLNIDRVRRQRAVSVLQALLASGLDDLSPAWGDAIAADPAEAESIVEEANYHRARARARRRGRP